MRGSENKLFTGGLWASCHAGAKMTFVCMGLYLCLSPSGFAADDYLDAIEAEANSRRTAAAASESPPASESQPNTVVKADSTTVSSSMREEFSAALKHKSSATLRTYNKLDQKRQDEVVSYYFSRGKSMDNIVMKIFEQLSDQVRK